MVNDRGAGRKAKLSRTQIEEIIVRHKNGESMTMLASKYGLSRQALYKHIQKLEDNNEISIDYVVDGAVKMTLVVDTRNKCVRIKESIDRILAYGFLMDNNHAWESFSDMLENHMLVSFGYDEMSDVRQFIGFDRSKQGFSLEDVVKTYPTDEITQDDSALPDGFYGNISGSGIPWFEFTKSDILTARTDTDGFQPKAVSKDGKWFIKSQAIIGGIRMNDWAVEILASDICRQLDIPCVLQKRCEFLYGGHSFDAVYSRNFEMDGISFVSFERLLEITGGSMRDGDFIRMNPIEKLKWCAAKLSEAGGLPIEETEKYMLDLAVVDCLVGNVDRHGRNFGLFYDSHLGVYKIPMLFDNGMGLFEHDYYRDEYKTFDEAMRTVYVSPYGVDPFDMIQIIDMEYGLSKNYPGIKALNIKTENISDFAIEYINRMRGLINGRD